MIHRIIGKLDIKGPNLVKGVHLEGLRVLGRPEDFARVYYNSGIDELIYMDVVASLFGRNSLQEIITQTAKEIFIPLTVGGGIRTLDDIKAALRAGADKISLNTAAIKNPNLIKEASEIFGSSTITVSIEAIKQSNGEYLAFTDNGREFTGVEVVSWAKLVEKLGAGEILLTSIDCEGTGSGFDLDLTKSVARSVSIPVIACGGAGAVEDIASVIDQGKADAVALGSVLHYYLIKNKQVPKDNLSEGNIEFLKSGQEYSKVKPYSVNEIKKYLDKHGIECRK